MKAPVQPPRWATRLLHRFGASHLVDDLEGDLLELFMQRLRSHGAREARRRYVYDVLSLMRPFALKEKPNKYPQSASIQPAMIRNYLKIAFRNLAKHKMFSLINVLGLSSGMTACFLITLYVHFELTYDAFNTKADRIYRVATDVKTNSETLHYAISPWAMASNLRNEFPEIEAFVRVQKDQTLFRKGELQIQGDVFVSMSTYTAHQDKNIEREWGSFGAIAFILLKPGADPSALAGKLPAFMQRHAGKLMAEQQMRDLLSVKVNGKNVKQALSAIENQWKAMRPDRPFNYYFLDEFYDRQYRSEERFEALFLNFAGLAIFISCLGLLGLASYSTVQRTKEIGVRKVLGASAASIVRLLSKDFLQLIGLAFLVAAPLAWFAMHRWLQSFAYKANISLWIFVAAAFLSTLIALATISVQSIRAALMNPVKSLRNE